MANGCRVMREPPKLEPPRSRDEIGSYLQRLCQQMNDLTAWIAEAVEKIEQAKHEDDDG